RASPVISSGRFGSFSVKNELPGGDWARGTCDAALLSRWSTHAVAATFGCARLSQEARMLTRKTWHRTALITLTAITMSAGLAWATHVRIEGTVEQPWSPGMAVTAPPHLQAD